MHYDLLIVGTGSGNSILTPDYDDWSVAIVERDVFGGTCLNRGCIPSKMFVAAANVVETVRHSSRLGVDTNVERVRWGDIVDRVFGRIDPIAAGGEEYRKGLDNVTVVHGDGRFVDHKTMAVGDQLVTADQVVLAAGARPFIPPIPGIEDAGVHTSDTIMRLRETPERLAILGGGYIAAEMGHVFDSLGSSVTIVQRSGAMLRAEDEDISRRFTEAYAARFDLRLNTTVESIKRDAAGRRHLELSDGETLVADEVLVAIGRTPNGTELQVEATGVQLDDTGYVVTDEHMRTNVEGIWALGDICNPAQLKHTANAEARVVAHNMAHPEDLIDVDLWPTPHAVFGHPQVASVGETEQALRAAGTPFRCAIRRYSDTAYGWALEDVESCCKVIAHAETRQLLGAHIMGPQASTLIQQLIQGMRFGQTVDQMAREQLYIHPALTEVVEQALLEL